MAKGSTEDGEPKRREIHHSKESRTFGRLEIGWGLVIGKATVFEES